MFTIPRKFESSVTTETLCLFIVLYQKEKKENVQVFKDSDKLFNLISYNNVPS